jgi:hypothetical protein
LNEQGQLGFVCKSEGQLLEDVMAEDEPMLASVSFFPRGSAALASPNDDDPLVYQKVVGQLRREMSLRPSHIEDGGGDASQVCHRDCFEFKRPFGGPSLVDDGGGDEFKRRSQASNQWLTQSMFPEVELPTEVRKKELRSRMAGIEQSMLQDPRFHSFVWRFMRWKRLMISVWFSEAGQCRIFFRQGTSCTLLNTP